jgi:hypothetical protein
MRPLPESATIDPMSRRFQFSLRTLLVGPVVLACWLGWHVERVRRQRDVATLVADLGGTVQYDDEFDSDGWPLPEGFAPSNAPLLRRWIGHEFFHAIVYVSLARAPLSDDDLARLLPKLAAMGTIRELALSGTEITDAGIAGVGSLIDLRQLWVNETRITDRSLANIGRLHRLQNLQLQQTKITDNGLRHLRGMSSLLVVNLYETSTTESGAAHLHDCLPNTNVGTARHGLGWFEADIPLDLR